MEQISPPARAASNVPFVNIGEIFLLGTATLYEFANIKGPNLSVTLSLLESIDNFPAKMDK